VENGAAALHVGDNRLVTGSEPGTMPPCLTCISRGHDESGGRIGVPDAAGGCSKSSTSPERVAKFQLGQSYRLPLFELVFHDCIVSYWYWGDYSNKLPRCG